MEIEFCDDLAFKFTEIIMKKQIEENKQRCGLHRSDMHCCPHKPFNRNVRGLEAIHSPESIGYFLLGAVAHLILHENFSCQEYELNVCNLMTMHLDAIAQGSDFQNLIGIEDWGLNEKRPIESKTTRKNYESVNDLPIDYIEQLAFGMAYLGTNVGYIFIVNNVTFAVHVVRVKMTSEERDRWKNIVMWKITQLNNAELTLDDSKLEVKRYECKTCEFAPSERRAKIFPNDKGCPYYNPYPEKPKKPKKEKEKED